MRGLPRIVAAALGACGAAGLVVTVLASWAGGGTTALVSLEIAPRGPGTVSATPAPTGDPNPCTQKAGAQRCVWQFERGTPVELRATTDAGAGNSFFGWSDPECGTAVTCTVRLDDDATSVVAVFSPLRLAVFFSGNNGNATVDGNPDGQPCVGDEIPGGAKFCEKFPAHTRVALTIAPGSTAFRGWNEVGGVNDAGDYLCEPVNSTTCTITVEDDPTSAGARFADDPPPILPPTISVQFKLRKGGDGSGRVTATQIDCGTVCSATFRYGKRIALTAKNDDGSSFGGWNGVCAAAQTTCTVPAGPITSVRAVFVRDATAPTVPGALRVTNRRRTAVTVTWAASSDNVGVTGYRVYLNGVAAGETRETTFNLERLRCGTGYDVAVDAVDSRGNRSERAAVRVATSPCALVGQLARVTVRRVRGKRIVEVRLRVNRATTAQLRLVRGRRTVQSRRFRVSPGTNRLRLPLGRRLPRGQYRLVIRLANPDGGRLVLPGRRVRVPRP